MLIKSDPLQNDAHESSAPGHLSVQEYPPPANINMRRVLANYEPHPPPTDFEPWQQAQEAITSGVSVHDVVKREFARDFGPHAVQCAPPICASVRCLPARLSLSLNTTT